MVRGTLAFWQTAPGLLLVLGSVPGGCGHGTPSETLTATSNPARALSTPGAATPSKRLNCFQPFTAALPVNCQVRTTPAGSGAITLQTVVSIPPARRRQSLHSPILICKGNNA